jgi:hypothetical protein
MLEEGNGERGLVARATADADGMVTGLNYSAIHFVVPRRILVEQSAKLPELKGYFLLSEGEPNQIQLGHRHKQVRVLASIERHESALATITCRAARAATGAPDGATVIACEEIVIDSFVGLGFLRGRDGEGVNLGGFNSLHSATTFLLRFADSSFIQSPFQFFQNQIKNKGFPCFLFFMIV